MAMVSESALTSLTPQLDHSILTHQHNHSDHHPEHPIRLPPPGPSILRNPSTISHAHLNIDIERSKPEPVVSSAGLTNHEQSSQVSIFGHLSAGLRRVLSNHRSPSHERVTREQRPRQRRRSHFLTTSRELMIRGSLETALCVRGSLLKIQRASVLIWPLSFSPYNLATIITDDEDHHKPSTDRICGVATVGVTVAVEGGAKGLVGQSIRFAPLPPSTHPRPCGLGVGTRAALLSPTHSQSPSLSSFSSFTSDDDDDDDDDCTNHSFESSSCHSPPAPSKRP